VSRWNLRWTQGAIALFLLLAVVLIGLAVLKVRLPTKNPQISPPAIPINSSPAASQDKPSTADPAPSQKESPRDGVYRQETKVASLMAELTRFVYAGTFITAEVRFQNGGSRPVTFCCDDWQLIDEQTGDKLSPSAYGGLVKCYSYSLKTLAPGETHVAWTKFKEGAFSDDKYSLNIDTILNRPFEGLALKSQQ
jgi:hypothetical protein